MADVVLVRESANKQIREAQALIDAIQVKMRGIVDEFSKGEISREQFHKLYEHYQGQIMLATQVMAEADTSILTGLTPGETIAIRSKLTAKAKAMTVYYHSTGLLLETLGDFDLPVSAISSILNNISDQVAFGKTVETRIECIQNLWVLFAPGKYSTAVMLFSNEPARRQIGIIEGMHRDFETANLNALRGGHAEGKSLVYPFQSFVRRSMTKTQ